MQGKIFLSLIGVVILISLPNAAGASALSREAIDILVTVEASSSPLKVLSYRVKKGDTLVGISRRYFGTPTAYHAIATINNLNEPYQLEIGDTLKIPFPQKGSMLYVVKKGDTILNIARQFYGDPYQYKKIVRISDLKTPINIKVGEMLILPGVRK